jgi:hypothetical protein
MQNSPEKIATAIYEATETLADIKTYQSVKVAQAIDGLAAQFQELAFQLSRIADVVEEHKNA